MATQDNLKFVAAVLKNLLQPEEIPDFVERCKQLSKDQRSAANATESFGMVNIYMAGAHSWQRLAELLEEEDETNP